MQVPEELGGLHADGLAHLHPDRLPDCMQVTEELLGAAASVPLLASLAPDAADDDPERTVLAEDLRPFLVPLQSREAHVTLTLLAAALLGVPRAIEHLQLPSSHPLAVIRATAAPTPEALAEFAPAPPDDASSYASPADASPADSCLPQLPPLAVAPGAFARPPRSGGRAARSGAPPPMVAGCVAEGGPQQRQLARDLLWAACHRYTTELQGPRMHPNAHRMHTECTPNAHRMHTERTLNAHRMHP